MRKVYKQFIVLMIVVSLMPCLMVEADEYTEVTDYAVSVPVDWKIPTYSIFTKVSVGEEVLDFTRLLGHEKSWGMYGHDWTVNYDTGQNVVYLVFSDGNKIDSVYSSTDIDSFCDILDCLLVKDSQCYFMTTNDKEITCIGRFHLYWEGFHELLASGVADAKVKRTIIQSLGYYGTDTTLPAANLSVGGNGYEVLDTSKLPLVLVDKIDMRHPAITLEVRDNSYSIMYEGTDITDLAGQLAQKPDECGKYWKAITATLRQYQDNYNSYLTAASQQGTGAAVAEYNTAYDYYAARIAGYWLKGGADVLTELRSYPGDVAVRTAGKGSLSEEEKLRLQVFASILGKCENSQAKGDLDSLLNTVTGLQWNPQGGNQVDVTNSSAGLTMDKIDNEWTKLYSDKYRDYNAVADQTIEGLLGDAYAAAVYNSAIMYGATVSADDSAINNLGTIPRSEYIESITFNANSAGIDMLNLNFSDTSGGSYYGIPAMKNITKIANTEDAYNAYYNLNLMIAIIAGYCNNNAADFEMGSGNWIDQLAAADASNIVNLAEYSVLKDNLNKVRACININEALTYLGVDTNWLDSIKTVCRAGNALQAYKDVVLKLQSEYVANEAEPMKTFFNLSQGTYATDYLTGVALSSTFKPMQTNMYDVRSVSFVEDTEWVTRFHYPWGFYRKVLYIDTNTSAAVDKYVTSSRTSKGNTRIATLGDLLQPEKDIVLYVDDRYYNTEELASKMGMAYNKLQNTEDAVTDGSATGLLDKLKEVVDIDVESIVKTGGNTAYSRSVYDHVAHIGEEKETLDFADSSLLDLDTIACQLKGYSDEPNADYAKQYSVMQSYAVVSAIYRDQSLYAKVSGQTGRSPAVFVSSPNLFAMDNVPQSEFNTLYNYAMLKNLEDVLPMDYKSQLDLNEPLYMDIYGNILTDSGTVVIPAMSNATLCGVDFNPVTVGFMYLYNKGSWKIPGSANNCDIRISESFALDSATGDYMLTSQRFDNVRINLANAQLSDEGVLNLIYQVAQDNCNTGGYLPFDRHVYWMTEVLRGAPLEFIDKEAEMITTQVSYSKIGISIAYKLNEVIDAFYSEEHKVPILSIPNLAFMNGFEYVILYLFKLVFVTLFVLLIYRLYIDAVSGKLGIKSVVSFIMSVVMFLVTCFAVPMLLDVSYYQVNKRLLKEETLQTVLLSAEKKAEGREIGVTGIQGVKNDSKLYLKVDDLSIPWYAILDDILVSDTTSTLDALYEEEFKNSNLANLPRFERQGQNLYIDVDELMRNSVLLYDKEACVLQNVAKSTPYESFVTPYYAILDMLVSRVNAYNIENSLNNFDTKVMSGGQVKTLGVIAPYFVSEDFMDTSRDPAGIRDIYGVETTLQEATALDDTDRDAMSKSYWYADIDKYNENSLEDMFQEIDREARHFVAEHRVLLGKISDETFLEVMALSIACKHNSIFRIGNADALEIFDIDSTDIIRLSIAPIQQVMSQCSKSFARFVYDAGGTLGVVTVILLLVVYVIGAVVKPVCLVIMIACLFMSVGMRKLVKREDSKAVEGYLLTMAIICVCNVLFSLLFKASMFLPDLGLSMPASACVQIVLQCLYIIAIAALTMVVVKDWRNAGYESYYAAAAQFTAKIAHSVVRAGYQTINNASMHINQGSKKYAEDEYEYDADRDGHVQPYEEHYTISGTEILNEMHNRDRERRSHARRR